jgi:two-component system, OmpR family, sensor histidine kinase KdpD
MAVSSALVADSDLDQRTFEDFGARPRRADPASPPGHSASEFDSGRRSRESSLLAVVAHELRAPLTVVAMSSELLAEDFESLDRPQIRQMLATIHRGTTWLQSLVENLLCDATIREGQFTLHPRPTSLLDVVTDIEPVVRPILARKGHELRVSRRPIRLVSADSRLIGQVLVNLISNAAKYAGPGQPVEIWFADHGSDVRVTVADRGPGIREGAIERIFEPYQRGEVGAQSDKDGLGLGLAIVKWIVEAHRGQIGAMNRPGGGACFWFSLPAVRRE